MDLKRVSRIPAKYKTIVQGYVGQVQTVFPDQNSYFNIVDLIKHIILLYFYQGFESKILSDHEQEIFRNLFIENKKFMVNNDWKLIYRGSRDGFAQETCVLKVYDKPNIIILISIPDPP